jgi:hypothetical protein
MPGLLGYMIAIVVTLGGYLAALQWLVTPPDPWQSNPKAAQLAPQIARKRLPPVVAPAQAHSTPATLAEPHITFASIETSASVQGAAPETVLPAEPHGTARARPAVEPAHVIRRQASTPKARSGIRNRIEKNTSRKLELMVLRTYERSDGRRFTRLLPLSGARTLLAFQPDDRW